MFFHENRWALEAVGPSKMKQADEHVKCMKLIFVPAWPFACFCWCQRHVPWSVLFELPQRRVLRLQSRAFWFMFCIFCLFLHSILMCLQFSRKVSSSGATLSFASEVKGRLASPATYFFKRLQTQNTVIYMVFVNVAWKNHFLQHAENCVNTRIVSRLLLLARTERIVNTEVFRLPRRKTMTFTVLFAPRDKKKRNQQPIWLLSATTRLRKKAAGATAATAAAAATTTTTTTTTTTSKFMVFFYHLPGAGC